MAPGKAVASAAQCHMAGIVPTREARGYALKELARRAGVSREFFARWEIRFLDDSTRVSFGAGCPGEIHFVHAGGPAADLGSESLPVSRAAWPATPPPSLGPDLILPGCASDESPLMPLYSRVTESFVVCRLDVLFSMLFMLSRLEETLSAVRDDHGRFPSTASLAQRHNFLERPVLDEHGLAFQQILASLIPGWRPAPPQASFKLTHDIDEIGIPLDLRSIAGHIAKRGKPSAAARDLLSGVRMAEPTGLQLVRRLAQISASRGLQSAFFWKAGPCGPYDSGYDTGDKRVQRVIEDLWRQGSEFGVHPGYDTFGHPERLAEEVGYLRQTLKVESPGGRQHYLRWSPQTWLDWEACGLLYDSSVGFADAFGFRAGTAFPYRPWSLEQNRELNLIEMPLILMDCTPVKYMRIAKDEALPRIRTLAQRVAATGGVFTLLWHNAPLLEPAYDGWYEAILDVFANWSPAKLPGNVQQLW